MSEEPSTPAAEGDLVPHAGTPPRRRRKILIAGIAGIAGIVGVLVAGAVILAIVLPGSQPPQYTSLPAPCAMITLASLTKYVPDPTGLPESMPTFSGVKASSCQWSSAAGRQDRALTADVFLYNSSSATSLAREGYDQSVSHLDCRCKGAPVSRQPVAGLGDLATATFIAGSPGNDVAVPGAPFPGLSLFVWSHNADIFLFYNITAPGTGQAVQSEPTSPAQLAGMIAMARDVLAALSSPATASSRATAHLTHEPRYAGPLHPCALVMATTLTRYAPGVTATQITNRTPLPSGAEFDEPQVSTCDWASDSSTLQLTLTVYPNGPYAATSFSSDLTIFGQSGPLATVNGIELVRNLGEEATAILQTQQKYFPAVDLLVRSGNAEINLDYAGMSSATPRAPLLEGDLAIARQLLAALAGPKPLPTGGPQYANPDDACALVKAATLDRYAPGSLPGLSSSPVGGPSAPLLSGCSWAPSAGPLGLNLTVYPDSASAQQGFGIAVGDQRQNGGGTVFNGAQSVKGLGQQATAIFQTVSGSQAVLLNVWSGNADIEISFTDDPFPPTLSPAAKLAAAIAVARDVLADLRRA